MTTPHLPSYPHLCGLLANKPTRLSQAMHSAAFQALGVPYVYVAFDTTDTEGGIAAMRCLGMRGLSLTIPHKIMAVSLCDWVDEHSRAIGAVNTLINDEGQIRGYNTDWLGIVRAYKEAGVRLEGEQALIIGAGGAARAAMYALAKQGMREIVVANRTKAKAVELAEECQAAGPCRSAGIGLEQLGDYIPQTQHIFNASPVGSHLGGSHLGSSDEGFESLIGKHLTPSHTVFDAVTSLSTPLLKAAQTQGAVTISGLRMLLFQAVEQCTLFTGCQPPVPVMEGALLREASAS